MKLRFKGNSVRIRLTRTEVATLAEGGSVSQTTSFSPTTQLVSSIGISGTAKELHATLENCHVHLTLPLDLARQWANSDQVSISGNQRACDGQALAILVEKDFECLHHPRDTDDTFPNPRAR